MNLLLLPRYSHLGPSSRLRCFQFLPSLWQAGIECTVQPLFNDALLSSKYKKGNYALVAVLAAYFRRIGQMMRRHRFDLVWVEKEVLPWLPARIERAFLGGVPYVLDYDDAIFHNYDLHKNSFVRFFLGKKINQVIQGAALVMVGNDYLASYAHQARAPWVEIVPTVVDLERYSGFVNQIELGNKTEEFVVGWIGSPSTTRYLALLANPLAKLSNIFSLRLRVIGGGDVKIPGVKVENLAWHENAEVSMLKGCDVGVMPLTDTPWERGKCGYKLIQYMACEKPVVASPVGVNTKIVQEGVNGFLAHTEEDWMKALKMLIANPEMKKQIGQNGRKIVERDYSLQCMAPRLIELLRKAVKNVRGACV